MAAELYDGWYISANQYDVGPSSGTPSAYQEHNADLIYATLHSLGWTDNAIAGMVGNVMYESCIDPACAYPSIGSTLATIGNTYASQHPDNAYGLVQWLGRGGTDPNNNQLVGYAIRHGYEWYDGVIQMERLTWEYQNNQKFHAQSVDGVYYTFSSYAASTASASVLAKAWMVCYEGTYSVLTTRQANAETWYDYFTGGQPPQPTTDWVSGSDFAGYALSYDPDVTGVDIPYSTLDCIGFVNKVWKDIPVVALNGWNLTNGTHSIWRSTRTFNTTSPDQQNPTPELWYKDTISNCISTYGQIPTGALLFHQIDEAGPPAIPPQYAGDGIGNFVHVGIYCGNNTVMQSGGQDSATVPGGGVHKSVYDSSAWTHVAFVVYVDCTGSTPPVPPPSLPVYYYFWYTNSMKGVKKRVRKVI